LSCSGLGGQRSVRSRLLQSTENRCCTGPGPWPLAPAVPGL
jgi:hypothetical protein